MGTAKVRHSLRRKIRLDRGDTLGGTVPLTLRDHVMPDFGHGERRFSRRRRRRGGNLLSWVITVLLALGLAAGIGFGIGAFGDGTGKDGTAASSGPAADESTGEPGAAEPEDPDTLLIERLREVFDAE